jgi:trk system potassium uptake protein
MPRTIIVGCGRVGAGLAVRLAESGHDVTVIDINGDAFRRLDAGFPGDAIRGDGTDEDVLRRAGTEGADFFYALTEGDNRNVLTAQLAVELFGVRDVVAKVNDPVRAEAYRALGLNTICRTTMLVDALTGFARGAASGTGSGGVMRSTGAHPGGETHHPTGTDEQRVPRVETQG